MRSLFQKFSLGLQSLLTASFFWNCFYKNLGKGKPMLFSGPLAISKCEAV